MYKDTMHPILQKLLYCVWHKLTAGAILKNGDSKWFEYEKWASKLEVLGMLITQSPQGAFINFNVLPHY